MRILVVYNLVETIEKGLEIEKISDNEVAGTVERVVQSLEGEHLVLPVRVSRSLVSRLAEGKRPDLVFNLCEGLGGNVLGESYLPAILEVLGIPYTGSSPFTLALCLDKAKTKEVLLANGVPTPRYKVVSSADDALDGMPVPAIVKPLHEDGSVGIFADSVVEDGRVLRKKVWQVMQDYRQPALVEEFIDGRELNVAIVGNPPDLEVLPVSEIVFDLPTSQPRIVSFEAKWLSGSPMDEGTRGVCPAQLDEPTLARVRKAALEAYALTGCQDYGRVDIRLRDGVPYVLEVNPNPGINADSGFVRSAAAAGLDMTALVRRIVDVALARCAKAPAAKRRPLTDLEARMAGLEGEPVLWETEHLSLQPVRREHLPVLLRWFNDPEVVVYRSEPSKSYSLEELVELFFIEDRPEVDCVFVEKARSAPVAFGFVGGIDPSNMSGELSFSIPEPEQLPRPQRREIVDGLLAVAFARLGLNSVRASAGTESRSSVALLKEAGFAPIGRRRATHVVDGTLRDDVLFDMLRSDHEARRAAAPAGAAGP